MTTIFTTCLVNGLNHFYFVSRKRDKKSRRQSNAVDDGAAVSSDIDIDKKKKSRNADSVTEIENDKKSDDENVDSKDVVKDVADVDSEERAKREKEERVAASLRKREAEVAKELSGHLHARDKEREQHRHAEAVSNFQALLTDLIRLPDFTWKEARKVLKKDVR